MRILAIGDINGEDGREFIYNNLGRIKSEYNVDFCVANGENSADPNGITYNIADSLIRSGVDIITMGNHTFDNKESSSVLEENECVIRPLNYPPECEGNGYAIYDTGVFKICVINLIGRISMPPVNCPFHAADSLLKRVNADIVLVDMHAEATSEKIAMAHFLDGRVSAVFGTHTHVQTADERILENGTGFICDLGMTGVEDSVLGIKKDIIIESFLRPEKRRRFEKASGRVIFCGCIFDIDENSKKCLTIKRLRFSHI